MTYQLLLPLRDEEYDALKADIARRGVMVPVERDEHGALLDGHHRVRICQELGLPEPPSITRIGMSEQEKREHVIKLNLARRHLDPVRWGQAFAQLIEERGARRGKGGDRKSKAASAVDIKGIAAEVGVPERTARYRLAEWDAYQSLPEEAQEQVDAGRVKPRAVARQAAKKEVAERIAAEPLPMPEGPYRVIVADPPWRYDKRAEDTTHRSRLPYPDMSVDEIARLDVRSLAHDDAVLWLWTTNAFLEHAFRICHAWGFEPKTVLTWAKDRMGTGDWLRGQTEHCLLAVRGKPVVSLTNQTTLLRGPLREHSRKPDEFYALVESLCPGAKVELFAREARPGWALWGAEAPAA